MSVKQYGIYLNYAPTVDLRHEGLGRYLAAFLNGAAARDDVRFVLLCPSWSHESLQELFSSEGVPAEKFEVVSPKGKPWILRGFELVTMWKKRVRKQGQGRLRKQLLAVAGRMRRQFERSLSQAYGAGGLLKLVLLLLPTLALGLAILPLLILAGLAAILGMIGLRLARKVVRPLKRFKRRTTALFHSPKEDGLVLRLYRSMEQMESERMAQLAAQLPSVQAWYCPTAFWPAFNALTAPKLMCVPDVVLSDFPVGFSGIGGDRFLENFNAVECSIRSGQHFVTYSNAVKWLTLVDRYAAHADNVSVVHHAPNTLNRWVTVKGFPDVEATSRLYCQNLLQQAVQRSNNAYIAGFKNKEVKFLFYASQFRPNKNVLTLLKAYEYLLRKRFITHKLILTGRPKGMPEFDAFIRKNNLQNDVLCLSGLSVQQLAACYKLADLAVNPSLSEGGCPFTFTEALSVDTPVVMARIPVTEEVLTDQELQEITFFDPYDWRDMAVRIEWGLTHRETLLQVQRKTYAELVQRSWTDVVNEHIAVLDRISNNDSLRMGS